MQPLWALLPLHHRLDLQPGWRSPAPLLQADLQCSSLHKHATPDFRLKRRVAQTENADSYSAGAAEIAGNDEAGSNAVLMHTACLSTSTVHSLVLISVSVDQWCCPGSRHSLPAMHPRNEDRTCCSNIEKCAEQLPFAAAWRLLRLCTAGSYTLPCCLGRKLLSR